MTESLLMCEFYFIKQDFIHDKKEFAFHQIFKKQSF